MDAMSTEDKNLEVSVKQYLKSFPNHEQYTMILGLFKKLHFMKEKLAKMELLLQNSKERRAEAVELNKRRHRCFKVGDIVNVYESNSILNGKIVRINPHHKRSLLVKFTKNIGIPHKGIDRCHPEQCYKIDKIINTEAWQVGDMFFAYFLGNAYSGVMCGTVNHIENDVLNHMFHINQCKKVKNFNTKFQVEE